MSWVPKVQFVWIIHVQSLIGTEYVVGFNWAGNRHSMTSWLECRIRGKFLKFQIMISVKKKKTCALSIWKNDKIFNYFMIYDMILLFLEIVILLAEVTRLNPLPPPISHPWKVFFTYFAGFLSLCDVQDQSILSVCPLISQ